MPEHVRGQAVPEQVCPSDGRMEIGSAKRAAHDRRDRPTIRERPTWGSHTQKHVAAGARGTITAEIRGERSPDLGGQREAIVPKAFCSANRDLTGSPVEVIELQRHHLARSKAQSPR